MEKSNNERIEIAILLSTFNGELYIEELINSLLNQSFCEWFLYIHDDGSTDKTITIIDKYSRHYTNIKKVDLPINMGAKDSFLSMLSSIEADYYFFCDQDDVWKENKIERSIQTMRNQELLNPSRPIIVHSDLEVTDENLNTIFPSFWKQSGIDIKRITDFNRLGAHCLVTGCTMLINQEAKNSIIFSAPDATMHDIWISLCVAKNNGIIIGIEEPLIKYRQHSNNALGLKSAQKRSIMIKLKSLRQIIAKNRRAYKMLKALDYGSPFKYIFYKFLILLGW